MKQAATVKILGQKLKNRGAEVFSITLLLLMALAVLFASQMASRDSVFVVDFSRYPAGAERKQAFVDYFLPIIARESDRILQTRVRILALRDKTTLTRNERNWLLEVAARYRLPDFDLETPRDWIELLSRVDRIPASLALAQSANESGWGTSRFARLGHNYFGQWCFSRGCGIVPSARAAGSSHEVQVFTSPRESVVTYMRNLNSHPSYALLREIRAKLRGQHQAALGEALAEGLIAYSERGADYVEELQRMIRYNGWRDIDGAGE